MEADFSQIQSHFRYECNKTGTFNNCLLAIIISTVCVSPAAVSFNQLQLTNLNKAKDAGYNLPSHTLNHSYII